MIERITKHNKKYNYTSEKLLNAKSIEPSGFFGLWGIWDYYDRLGFSNLPNFVVSELNYNEDANTSMVGFQFSNLSESLGRLSRIIIYYEKGDPSNIPSNLDFDILQKKKVFSDIPVISIGNTFIHEGSVELYSKPVSYYNFYAVYLDTLGQPAKIGSEDIISYAINIPFYGNGSIDQIMEVKNLKVDSVNLNIYNDIDNAGFLNPVQLNTNHINLSWTSPYEYFIKNISKEVYFKDTYNNQLKIPSKQLKEIDYYVVYKYTTSKNLPPLVKMPQKINHNLSLSPSLTDPNGKWEVVDKTQNTFYSIDLEYNTLYAFWVGFKLKG